MSFVIPAHVGIQGGGRGIWTPACAGVVLIRLSIPIDPADAGTWLKERAGTVSLALSLLPFAGIAFLWFIGVMRDRIGHLEDQFFSTVFFGSGLLFLAMTLSLQRSPVVSLPPTL